MSRREPHQFKPVSPDPDGSGANVFWKSLEEKQDPAAFTNTKETEFPFSLKDASVSQSLKDGNVIKQADAVEGEGAFDRRNFIKLGTVMTALLGLEGCIRRPIEKIVPYTRSPENVIPGISNHYATVYARRGEAVGLLVESHEGRPTKIEGNPEHPSSKGATDLITQASIMDLYDPDRSTSPKKGGANVSFEELDAFLADKLKAHDADKGAKLRVLAPPTNSPTFLRLRDLARTRFPEARFHTYAAVDENNAREGARLAYGQPVHAIYDYARARVILSLDSDFLQTEPGAIRATRGFADGRRLRSPSDAMSRLYVVESTYSTTGANADHRLRIASRDVERYTRLLAKALVAEGVDLGPIAASLGDHPADGIPAPWIHAVAKELAAHRGRAVVVPGSRQPPSVHALAHALNAALGGIGQVVTYAPVVDGGAGTPDATGDLKTLLADIDAKKVDTLFILGGNPVYDAPGDASFGDRLATVPTSVHLASHVDETSAKCTWHIPRAHELEAWSDQRSLDGTWSIQQPLIAPIYGGRTDLEILATLAFAAFAAFAGSADDKPRGGFDLVRDTLREKSQSGILGFDKQWRNALQRGLLTGSAPFAFTPTEVKGTDIAAELAKPAPSNKGAAGTVEVVFAACPKKLDGRHANNAWLNELPDPMTKIVWDNAAHFSPKTAADLGLKSGDLVELAAAGKPAQKITIAAWIQPGQADGSVTVYLGWGRTAAGRYGTGKGFDVNPLRSLAAMHFADGVSVRNTGETYKITQTQDHHSMEGRPVAIDTTLAKYKETPTFAQFRSPTPKTLPLWPRVDYSRGHRWGMNIDLNACTGCNACVIACQAENNIPTVGKDQVGRGREMHWIRIDRYFVGNDIADPQVAVQPVACVQCEEAPCENVCPVNATAHSPEGLNDMAYNRCIGTRYCANNCPYKVRRFNYYEFQGEPFYGDVPETQKMQHNPNVTVRMRGVMEKCTYCVQRIQETKIASKRTGKPVKDGDVVTACQQTCPANAISFGDLNDPAARVTDLAKRDRSYELLSEIGTHPRTTYLGKIRNPNQEMG
jgi:Fe-S-cluster-containing dehydrogenase component/anaerobic selenocysteine-containing dehydrogenase